MDAGPGSSSPFCRVHTRRALSLRARTVPARTYPAAPGGPPAGTTGMNPASSSWPTKVPMYAACSVRRWSGSSSHGTTMLFTSELDLASSAVGRQPACRRHRLRGDARA